MAMEPVTWVTATVVGLALLHLLLLGYLGSRRSATPVGRDGRNDAGGTTVEEDADVVRCRGCGAANDRDYRYCRNCVAELAGGTTPLGGIG